jgi:hypothetical protein
MGGSRISGKLIVYIVITYSYLSPMKWGKKVLFITAFLSSCLHGLIAQVDHWETIVFDNDTWKYFPSMIGML